MKAFIALLVHRVSIKHASLSPRREFSLVRIMTMNIACALEHLKEDIRNEMGGGIEFFETYLGGLEV